MELNPIDVQKHLKGVNYPASGDELVRAAEQNGADRELLEQLRGLTDDRFDGPADVMKKLAGE